MAPLPDLRLPGKLPQVEKYRSRPRSLLPFALYTLTPLSSEQLNRLREVCHREADEVDDDLENCISIPPRSDFSGETLKDIVDYHVDIAEEGVFDATRFLVCAGEDWEERGVLTVTLDDDDREGRPDRFFVRAEDALSLIHI